MDDLVNKRLTNAKKILRESTQGFTQEEAAAYYSELADWAYSESECLLIDNQPEMQDYENE